MKKPATRLQVRRDVDWWHVDLHIEGRLVARSLATADTYLWTHAATAKRHADRWAAALGNIPVVVGR